MPAWVWIVGGVGAAAVVAAVVVLALTAWNRFARRHAVQLLGKRREAASVRKAADELVTGLRDAGETQRAAFADDPDAVERHSLAELAERALILAEEVNTMPLPAKMVPAAEALADAAEILAEECERVGEGTIGADALRQLDSIDLGRVERIYEHAFGLVAQVLEAYGVDESAILGGGLYI